MLKRRLKDAGLSYAFSPHSFRATGITYFLENGGTLEVAQRIAGHADSRTTKNFTTDVGREFYSKTWSGLDTKSESNAVLEMEFSSSLFLPITSTKHAKHMMATLGTAVEEGVKTLPDIIKAAAESTLGILALMIVCLCLLGFLFFRGADVKVKLTIFLCLFGGVVAFGVSVVQEAHKPTVAASSPSTSTPASTSISPFQTSTQSPSPPTTPLSQQEIQSHWEPIIYYVLNSKLVESYVPDKLHPTDLVEAIRDNANLQDLIKNFESKVTDNVISGRWFTSIDNALDKIQQDLKSVDRGVAQSPELLRLYPQQRNQLQTAEYGRTQLLGLMTQVSLQLGMGDPGFPNNTAKVVPTATAVIPPPTPIHTKVLIFGDHFDQSKVYIVTGAPDYDLGPSDDHNQKYISRCCKGRTRPCRYRGHSY
jgi:hypothetical protein